ncbi:fungal-specific transcription factor domain-containing protein [Xylariaceae sp. FL1019]|nr:fungal-specific transcription factor domain-containing protein [Xylariaceae sp. FL1019]
MSGYYHSSSSSFPEMGYLPNMNPEDVQDTQYHHQQLTPQLESSPVTFVNPYQSLGYFTGFPDPNVYQSQTKPPSQNNRSRKKSTPGTDHVKHRRTRSGCYTCRSRRVKCDETRPICDRCRKGKRECVYPDPPATKGSTSNNTSKDSALTSRGTSPELSSDYEDDTDREAKLEFIPDEKSFADDSSQQTRYSKGLRRKNTISTLNLHKMSIRHSSETPSLEGTKSSSPSISTATSASFCTTIQSSDPARPPSAINPEWSHLQKELQYYLAYFRDNISCLNYGIPNDPDDFFKSILLSLAVQDGNESLLYAIVGFSAYHCTIRNPQGKIEDFFGYYNKSVNLLLSYLKREKKRKTTILLTILQLATIEEYLGDWVNLSGHQKAALEILTLLFTPETITQSPVSRSLLTWYVRFEITIAMMANLAPDLRREYMAAAVTCSQKMIKENPDDILWRIEREATALRLISADMAVLFAKAARGDISGKEFAFEHSQISAQLIDWKSSIDPRITDSKYLMTEFPDSALLTEDDAANPFRPGHLYTGPIFGTTILIQEWHSIVLMHKSQEGRTLQQEPSEELKHIALSICAVFEALRLLPSAPSGALIAVHAPLAMASIFVPRDERHHMWIRRRFAELEIGGYIFPTTMRTRMADFFHDKSCQKWWVPNDEGLNSTLRGIRAFTDENNRKPVSPETEAVREMCAIFSKMRMDEEETPPPNYDTHKVDTTERDESQNM